MDDLESGQHLHFDDVPHTLALLTALLGRKAIFDHDAVAAIGYSAAEYGAWVDWDTLLNSYLSSTEKAVVHTARGCAIIERAGGVPPEVAGTLIDTITRVAR